MSDVETAAEFVRYEQDGPVVLITIDRPERMNAIGPQVSAELIAAWDRFRLDDSASVGILTGAGEHAFCAGGDLKAGYEIGQSALFDAAELAAHARGERPGVLGPSRWTDIYKPTIAAVNGVAYAGGLEWACWTDMAIADAHATFGVTCRRWNIGLADGGTQRLPRIVGLGRALDMILTGRMVSAAEALSMGLLNEVVPPGAHLERALALAEGLASFPQRTMLADRRAAIEGLGLPLAEGLALEAKAGPEVFEDGARGAARFAAGEGRAGAGAGA